MSALLRDSLTLQLKAERSDLWDWVVRGTHAPREHSTPGQIQSLVCLFPLSVRDRMLSRINIQHHLIHNKARKRQRGEGERKEERERDGGMEADLLALLLREEADYLKTD